MMRRAWQLGLFAGLWVVSVSAPVRAADIRGSWQVNIDCGLFATATSFIDIAGPDEGPLTASTPACGTLQVPGEIHKIASCSQGSDTVDLNGSSFALPPAPGVGHGETSTEVPFTFPSYGCPAALVVNESRYEGAVEDDGAGTATRISGVLRNYLLQVYEPDNSLCLDVPDTLDCTFDMRRNAVAAGANVTVSPRAGTTVTFESVSAPGTAFVMPLTTPSANVPSNLNVLGSGGIPLYYDVHTTAARSGTITTCFTYADANNDGLVDGSGAPEAALHLLHDEGGIFTDRTVSLDTAANVICGETQSLSQLTLGVGAAAPTFACAPTPLAGCAHSLDPAKGKLQVRDHGGNGADQLTWKWLKGEAANPIGGADYALCFYDESGPTPALIFAAVAPQNGDCGAVDCWQATGTGTRFSKADAAPHGVKKIKVSVGAPGKSKVILKGQGAHLADGPLGPPPLPLPLPLRVQLQAENAACFEGVFNGAGMQRNDTAQFKGSGG